MNNCTLNIIKKIIAIYILLIEGSNIAYTQCSITATANNLNNDTIYICSGNSLDLNSTGSCNQYLMSNDFNNGIGNGWSSNAQPMFNNPCVPPVDGTTYLWIGPAANFPRELTTIPFNVTTACTICFDMVYSVQGVQSPCEGPDLPQEGVHLQWSNDGGATWTDIQYWAPNGGNDPNLTNWNNYCQNVPVAGTNIQFRWFQSNTSGPNYDHWGLDNVIITCPQVETVWWTGVNGFTYNNFDPAAFVPNQNGWYTVHITDGNYTGTDSIYVIVRPPINVSITPSNSTLCYGQTSTLISGIVSGGTPPYSYLWNTGATTSSITAGAGTYTLLVNDVSGCQPGSASTTISSFPQQITANAGTDQTICNSTPTVNLNGTVTAANGGIWTGGSGSYLPSNTSLTATYTPSSSEIVNGTVTLYLITTGNGACPADTDDIIINFVQFNESVTINTVDVSCYNGSDGTATISITNGSAPYTYNWNTNPQQTSQTASNLSQGTYSVTITNTYGCTNIQTVTINQPQQLTAIITPTNVSCYGMSNGILVASVFGGTPGYSYNWSNGGNGVSINNLTAGNYSCTITDAKGCTFVVNSTVGSPANLLASINTFNNVQCYGSSTGTATVTVSGGTPGYTYFWSSGAGTSQTAIGLVAGTYFVTVSDANGCSAYSSVQITEPTQININLTTTNTSCYGGNNGTASVVVTGGTPNYIYSWSPYGGNNPIATGLQAGNFILTVTDSRGCQQTIIATINQPPQLIVTINTLTNVMCFGGTTGSASISVTGGTPNYTYQWLPSGGTTPIASGLAAGNYIVSVTDANACVYQLNVFISQPSSALTANFVQNNVSCYSGTTGSITANPSGGTGPYTYIWQPGSITTQTISNLGAGTYFVTITDLNGCSLTNSVNITQPGGILLTTSTVQPTCGTSNGAATVSPSGGVPPYSYFWMPGAVTTSTINNIPSGIYYVTVTDFSGCSIVSTITLNDASGPVVTMSGVQNVSCFGGNDGSASVSVSGGTPPYTYSWSPYGGNSSTGTGLGAGTFIVLVSDINGCQGLATTIPSITQPSAISITSTQSNITCNGANNGTINLSVSGGTPPYTYLWSNSMTTPNLMSLSPGVYQVTVNDFNNCQDVYFVNIVEPNVLVVNINIYQNISCFGGSDGSATATVSGGTPPYNFLWSSGSTSQIATGFTSGTQTVFVTDSKGCSGSASVYLSQPSILSLITGFTNPDCFSGNNGFAWVVAAGGVPPYNYNWTPVGGTNDTAFNLQAGTYFITVTDQNSCQSYMPVAISQPSPVIVNILNYTNVSCFGGINGTALASVSGGTPAYQYSWFNGSTSPGITGLDNGEYSVTVTDARGCTDSASVTIFEPSQALTVSITGQDVSCYGLANGVANCVVTGGTAPYSYIWVPASQFNSTATNLIAGTYTVSVTDINGCQTFGNITINEPSELHAVADETLPVNCYGTNTGSASVYAWGGTPPYNYNWNTVPAQTTQNVLNIFAGNYFVTVTDDNGCYVIDSVIVTQPNDLIGTVLSSTNVSCYNGSNGVANVVASGGTPPYLYVWGTVPQQNGQSASGLQAGTYVVTITDNNNCQTIINVTINNTSQVITLITGQSIICLGDSTTLSASASGGAGNYLYYWIQGSAFGQSQTVSPSATTDYVVFAYDQNGCVGLSDTLTVYVKTFAPQNVDVFANSPVCAGTATTVYATAFASAFDTLTYNWSNGLGPGLGPFTVVPIQETTYTLTVTNTCGITVIDSVHVYFAPPPTIYFNVDITQGCMPVTVNIIDSSYSTFDDINSWTWYFSDGTTSTLQNPTHTFLTADTFYVYLSLETSGGCIASSAGYPLPVYVFPIPDASFEVNATTLYLPNDPVICTNTSTGGVAYLWDFGDGNTSVQISPTHNYNNLGQFIITLTATNMYGCTDSASISVDATGDIVFPNVFTPDINNSTGGEYDATDLTNHVFFPIATGLSEFKMMIFNRWGELIFESNDINIGWDGYYRGHLCQEDVYVFKASAVFVDGRKVEKIGDILLLR